MLGECIADLFLSLIDARLQLGDLIEQIGAAAIPERSHLLDGVDIRGGVGATVIATQLSCWFRLQLEEPPMLFKEIFSLCDEVANHVRFAAEVRGDGVIIEAGEVREASKQLT